MMDAMDLIRQGRLGRFFRATRKLNAPHLVSHITQRAAGKEALFLETSDYLEMLGLLKEISQKYDVRTFCFCLMPNHVHLLLSPEEDNLYEGMRDLFSRYAGRFNRKYARKGHLFAGPYRQAVCLEDSYLLAASLYIHLNPVKAGISPSPVEYRWSSCRLYVDEKAPESFVDPGLVLGLISEDGRGAKARYRELLERGMQMEQGNVFEEEGAVRRFHSVLRDLFPSLFRKMAENKFIGGTRGVDLLSTEKLEMRLAEIREGSLASKPQSRAAKKYVIEQLIARGYKRSDIAEFLGVSVKTVYNLLRSES